MLLFFTSYSSHFMEVKNKTKNQILFLMRHLCQIMDGPRKAANGCCKFTYFSFLFTDTVHVSRFLFTFMWLIFHIYVGISHLGSLLKVFIHKF